MDAGLEIVGELLGGALDAASTSDGRDKNGCGCLIMIAVLLIIAGIIMYYSYYDEPQKPVKTCGKIIYKLENDSILIDVKGKKKVFHISHELFENKKEGDSLCITK